jgi:acyl-CoA thioesterase-1
MKMPPNYGREYTEAFEAIYPALAAQHDLPLIPFLLDGVAGDPALNFPDGIHPTADGHKIMAETVWSVLQPVLEQRLPSTAEHPADRSSDGV